MTMEDLLVTIATSLVDDEDGVAVSVTPTDTTSVLELRVAASDLGKVIGKQGKTARAIRQILGAASRKGGGKRVEVKIIDEKAVAATAAASV